MRGALVRVSLLAAAAVLVLPAAAQAHASAVGRADLPIPAYLFGWGAAIVLVVSFLGLAVLWPTPRLQEVRGRRLFKVPLAVDVVLGVAGVAIFGIVVYAALAGVRSPSNRNLAPTFVYYAFWYGLPIYSLLLGDVYRALSPWRAIARATSWLAARVRGAPAHGTVPYPPWLGRWPAALTILGFAWLELAFENRQDPLTLGWLAIAYAILQLIGMTVFGIEEWHERGDGFGALFGLYARLAIFARRGRTLYVRPPLAGAPSLSAIPGTVALLAVAIGSTSFDGFGSGPVWRDDLQQPLIRFFRSLGTDFGSAAQWTSTVGLVVVVLLVAGFYALGILGMRTAGEDHPARELRGRFAHTLIPIAFAYALAHYFSAFVYGNLQVGSLASDPLGHGSDLFGTAHAAIDYGVITATTVWYVQVAALILGHVSGLVLAHDRAVAMYRSARHATRSQGWMLVVMVGFTSLGLWLLSAVNQ